MGRPCWIATTRRLEKLPPSRAPVDLIDDGRVAVTAAQEVGVQRIRHATFDRELRRRQCLAEHLPAEHLWAADVTADAAEDVVLDTFERQQLDQVRQGWVHVPGSSCRTGRRRP